MLRLENITKIYKTSDMEVAALKGVTLAFRRNEFVSILGPSGCGKTTTLNIIGGLDHYTSGNLYLMGRSTKEFTDHDWDIYRNHHIGFVFQSYNLIPHENIEENVDLALTIAGLGKEERKKRAREALDKVGLAGMYTKKPNQLSGGQCQRVAIARALVNEPDILLADEPTGALDSVTSVQIMDLIKEISKEKLVIMVTHNPDLASRYSTRIINLKDGEVIGDSNPYSLEEEKKESYEELSKEPNKEKEKAKMSWWTAFKLSAKNLRSKMKRTALVTVAASIGIVGVSAVMAVSSGVTGYIDGTEDDMLSGNPVYVATNSLDLSAMVNKVSGMGMAKTVRNSIDDGKIDVDYLIEQLASLSSSAISNDINEDYVRFIDQMPAEYYQAIEKYYGIDVFNNLYTNVTIRDAADSGNEKTTTYSLTGIEGIAKAILSEANDGKYAAYTSLISSLSSIVSQTLENSDYILSQYDLVTGKYPEKADEMVLVLNKDNETTDLLMTLLGYYSQSDFETILDYYAGQNDDDETTPSQETVDAKAKLDSVAVDRILNKKFTYYPNDTVFTAQAGNPLSPFTYTYEKGDSWTDGTDMKIVGILSPKEGTLYGSLKSGLYYTKAFTEKMLSDGKDSEIVKYFPTYKAAAEAMGSTDVTSYISSPDVGTGMGINYKIDVYYDGQAISKKFGLGSEVGFGASGMNIYSLSLHALGGSDLPSKIEIYPTNFDQKYQVTDYLDTWNDKEQDIVLKETRDADGNVVYAEKTLKAEDRDEVKYNDDLQVVITLVNGIISIVTIALVAFTSLSLVVSTVMIGIITYVSVMERIKEIGVIRSIGGRKKDVSHLFNAETFIIGLASGVFGIALTYVFELIMNLTLGVSTGLGMIANLSWSTALIVIAVSVALTMVAGLIPASAAARKDPVEALRTE